MHVPIHTYSFKQIHIYIPEKKRGFRLDHSLANLELRKRSGCGGAECRPIAFNTSESLRSENAV